MTAVLTNSRISRRGTAAFTLVEMVTSLLILTVLLLACGSIFSLASYTTMGAGPARLAAQIQSGDVAAQMTDDLNVAINFTERTANSTTFTVPDRLGAGSPQAVRYAWTGTAGGGLTRQFNGGIVATLANNVQGFSLSYLTRLMGPAPGPAQQTAFSHTSVLIGSAAGYSFSNQDWVSEYLVPVLPLGTASYSIKRVQLMLQADKGTGEFKVLVVMPDVNHYPNGAVLATATAYESALSNSSFELLDAWFTGLSNLAPGQGYCFEVEFLPVGGSSQPTLQYETSLLSIISGTTWATTNNSGASWSAPALASNVAMMRIYATVP